MKHVLEAAGYIDTKQPIFSLKRPDWFRQIVGLSKVTQGHFETTANAFSYGSTNESLGTVQISLPEIKRFSDMWDKLLGINPHLVNNGKKALEDYLTAEFSLKKALQTGGIGIRALAPKDYTYLFPDAQQGKGSIESLSKKYTKEPHSLLLTLAWLMTLLQSTQLNPKELLQLANELAQALIDYTALGKTATSTANDKHNYIDNMLNATQKSGFLIALTKLIEDQHGAPHPSLVQLREVIWFMQPESYRQFVALLKCSYVILRAGGKIS